MIKRLFYIVFLVLLLMDVAYSFLQHLNAPLDGDMAESIVPSDNMNMLYNNPFGINAIRNHQTYHNPNRFFCHSIYKVFFRTVPILAQKLMNPVDSVYFTAATAKILFQICIILLLTIAITGSWKVFGLDFILTAFLITPLFQTNGYRSYMGIIDSSITYSFFYALPCVLLLLYFLPFFLQLYHGKKPGLRLLIYLLWLPLGIIVSLSGPLNPGVVLVSSLLILFIEAKRRYFNNDQKGISKRVLYTIKNIPNYYWIYLIPICIFSIYSLYLGTYNSTTRMYSIPVSDLYLRLPKGIFYQFTQKLGFPVLFIILTINTIMIRKRYYSTEGQKILNIFKWIGIFSLLYVLLLPLGGFRSYRPNVLRYDTILPITLCLIFVFGATSLYLIKNISKKNKLWYFPVLLGVLFIFTNADEPKFYRNDCEKDALIEISKSKESIIKLQNDCPILSWKKIYRPEDSKLNSDLLQMWNITDKQVLYYQ